MNDLIFSETLSDSKTDREIQERASSSLQPDGSAARWEVTYGRPRWMFPHHRHYDTVEELCETLKGLAEDVYLEITVTREGTPPPNDQAQRRPRRKE
jgi:hypothetical protein